MSTKVKIILALLLIVCLFLIGCGAEVPKKELETAKQEILRAQQAQASDLDRENFAESKTELEIAEKLVNEKKNEEAKVKALNSIVKARTALINSKEKLLSTRIEKNDELIKEGNRYNAQKIAQADFNKGVSLNNEGKGKQQKIKNDKAQLNAEALRTGDSVAKLEVYLKDGDDGIRISTEAASFLEKALIAAKERIQKLEDDISQSTNIYNQLQKDSLISNNFKDKLESIKNKLNEANEYYKKFKFTDNAEEALLHLKKAEELALQAKNEATELNTEGRVQLQVLYKQRAQQALEQARENVNAAEKIYKNRQQPAGTERNPWIPRTYNQTQNKSSEQIQLRNVDDEEATETQTPQNNTPNESSNQAPNQGGQAAPSSERSNAAQQSGGAENTGNSQPQSQPQPSSTDQDIERQLEREGRVDENLTVDQLYAKMKEKLASAETKYNNSDYVGAWEDAEEAKRLAAKIKQLSGSSTVTPVTEYKLKETEIWKHYIVQYRRINTDCLWRIALKLYKDATLWPMIWFANKLKIADPDLIFPGQKLAIPKVNSSRGN